MRRAGKTDSTQKQIVEAFRAFGKHVQVSVHVMSSVGDGFPDLLVRVGEELLLVEVKSPPKYKLTKKQREFIKKFGGKVYRLNGREDVMPFILGTDRWERFGVKLNGEFNGQ